MKLFSEAFWAQTFELALKAFLLTFAGSQVLVTGFTLNNFLAALTAAGGAALLSLQQQLTTVQTVNEINTLGGK